MKNLKNLTRSQKPLNTLEHQRKIERRAKRAYAVFTCMVLSMAVMIVPAFAAPAAGGDPLQIVENLSDFIFSLIRAIGLILLGFGILQLGLSLKSHDPSQRANGMLTIAGGIVITFTKEILTLITGG
jgi:hydrogenase-4 membrane subunit HyfE